MSRDSTRWKTAAGCVYNVAYHIIWCPKYRRSVLVDDIATRLRTLLLDEANEIGCTIEDMEIMPDHVHLFIKSKPSLPIHHIVQQLKGVSSRKLRLEFPKLKSRLPTLWTRSYFVETIGHISEDTIKAYIENQKNV